MAIHNQNYECADLLLKSGIDDKIRNNKGYTAWDYKDKKKY